MRNAPHAARSGRPTGLALVLLGACASSPRLATAPPTLLIRVEQRPDSTPLMIWAVPSRGERLRLGLLSSGTSNVVRFDRVDTATQYRFVAERSGVPVATSAPFTPGRVAVVAWNLSTNTIVPIEPTRP
jgi:hypothetical protein